MRANPPLQSFEEFFSIRQELHQIPEIKYQERETHNKIVQHLKQFGYQSSHIQEHVGHKGNTGVIVTLNFGGSGKTVALRADMDGLPITEKANHHYISQNSGFMHACGHDGHCASLLAAAYLLKKQHDLKAHSSSIKGTVKFIFQPAEENGHGAQDMIDAGALNQVDAIFGFHNWPGLEVGHIRVRYGSIFAGNARFCIEIEKKEKNVCSISAGIEIIKALEKIRKQIETHNMVLNTTHFFTNLASNNHLIKGTCFFDKTNELEQLHQHIQITCHKIIEPYKNLLGIKVEFTIAHKPTRNSKAETDLIFKMVNENFGAKQVKFLDKSALAAEDFSDYLEKIPGCYYLIGNGEKSENLHTNSYDFDNRIIPVAAKLFYETAIHFLSAPKLEPQSDKVVSQLNNLTTILSQSSSGNLINHSLSTLTAITKFDNPLLIKLTISGIAAHTSQPQNAVNPVLIGAAIISDLSAVSKEYRYILNAFEVGNQKEISMSEFGSITICFYPSRKQNQEGFQRTLKNIVEDVAQRFKTSVDINYLNSCTTESLMLFQTNKTTSRNDTIATQKIKNQHG